MPTAKYADKPLPESRARQGEGEMDAEDLSNLVRRTLEQCQQFVEADLEPDRAKATEYYKGELFGDEDPGRSQVILTQVRDGIDALLPSLVRVFHGSERTVEFVPTTPEATDLARQATDYVNHVYNEDNHGFLTTLSVLKDGM